GATTTAAATTARRARSTPARGSSGRGSGCRSRPRCAGCSPAPARPLRMADLSVTALYTSGAWAWARLPGTDLLASKDAARVFAVTNGALALGGLFTRAPSLRCSLVQRHLIIDGLLAESGA